MANIDGGFLSGALQGLGSSTNDLADTMFKIKQLNDMNEYRQMHGQLWKTQLANSLAKQAKEQQALQVIQGISPTQEVPAETPINQPAIQTEATPTSKATTRTVTLQPHERYAKVAERLMSINPEMALKFQTKADEERDKIITQKRTVADSIIGVLEKAKDYDRMNKFLGKISQDPDIGHLYPADMTVTPQEKPVADRFTDWGHGQKRDLYTGEIIPVPTKPEKDPNAAFETYLKKQDVRDKVAEQKVIQGKVKDANREIKSLWDQYHASVRAGLPMSNTDWNTAYQSIKDRYSDLDWQPIKKGGTSQLKQLDQTTAAEILKRAGGDKNKAREIAKQEGYSF